MPLMSSKNARVHESMKAMEGNPRFAHAVHMRVKAAHAPPRPSSGSMAHVTLDVGLFYAISAALALPMAHLGGCMHVHMHMQLRGGVEHCTTMRLAHVIAHVASDKHF